MQYASIFKRFRNIIQLSQNQTNNLLQRLRLSKTWNRMHFLILTRLGLTARQSMNPAFDGLSLISLYLG